MMRKYLWKNAMLNQEKMSYLDTKGEEKLHAFMIGTSNS